MPHRAGHRPAGRQSMLSANSSAPRAGSPCKLTSTPSPFSAAAPGALRPAARRQRLLQPGGALGQVAADVPVLPQPRSQPQPGTGPGGVLATPGAGGPQVPGLLVQPVRAGGLARRRAASAPPARPARRNTRRAGPASPPRPRRRPAVRRRTPGSPPAAGTGRPPRATSTCTRDLSTSAASSAATCSAASGGAPHTASAASSAQPPANTPSRPNSTRSASDSSW